MRHSPDPVDRIQVLRESALHHGVLVGSMQPKPAPVRYLLQYCPTLLEFRNFLKSAQESVPDMPCAPHPIGGKATAQQVEVMGPDDSVG